MNRARKSEVLFGVESGTKGDGIYQKGGNELMKIRNKGPPVKEKL